MVNVTLCFLFTKHIYIFKSRRKKMVSCDTTTKSKSAESTSSHVLWWQLLRRTQVMVARITRGVMMLGGRKLWSDGGQGGPSMKGRYIPSLC